MKPVFLLSALALLLVTQTVSAEIYRWKDKDGRVHYSDNPPADAGAERARLYGNSIDVDKMSYDMRKATAAFPLTLYTSESCGAPCTQAKNWLKQRGVPFSEKNVKTQDDITALQKITGKANTTLPTLTIGTQVVEAFEAGAWGSALDNAGYPKQTGNAASAAASAAH